MAKDHDNTDEELEDIEQKEDSDNDFDDLDEEEDADGKEKDDGKEDDDDSDDEAPIKKGEFKKFQKQILDGLNSVKRHSMKNANGKKDLPANRKDGKEDPNASRIDRLEQSDTKRQFGYEHGLSPEQTDLVFKFNPKPSAKTLEHPFVKGGLAAMQKKKDISENTSGGATAKTLVVDGKKFDELDEAGKQKNFGAMQQAILRGKRR